MSYIIVTAETPPRFVKWGIDSIYLTSIGERKPKRDALRLDDLRHAEWYLNWAKEKYPEHRFNIIKV